MTMVVATSVVLVASGGDDDLCENSGDNAGCKKTGDDGGIVVLTRVDWMILMWWQHRLAMMVMVITVALMMTIDIFGQGRCVSTDKIVKTGN